MPKLKSSHKRLRTNLKARLRNRSIRSQLRTSIKQVRQAAEPVTAREALQRAISVIDRTAQKGVIHRNTAARYKSRLSHHVASIAPI